MRQRLSSMRFAGVAVAAILAVLPATAHAATNPALVYHATQAAATANANLDGGGSISVTVRTQSYRFTGGSRRPDFDAISIDITLTDSTGTIIDALEGFVPGSGNVAPNLSSATIPATTMELQQIFGGADAGSVTAGATITATGAANHIQFIARFCGPPQPCFGMFNIVGTEQPATATMSITGIVDGIDLSQLEFTSAEGGISSILGVELLG